MAAGVDWTGVSEIMADGKLQARAASNITIKTKWSGRRCIVSLQIGVKFFCILWDGYQYLYDVYPIIMVPN